MTFSPKQIESLNAKLDPKNVKSRSQAGRNLSYVEGWHVIAEANRIFGHDGWNRETVSIACAWTGEVNGKSACTYTAKVRVSVGDVVREGTGAGHGVAKGMGDAHESAIKEAETDAMKRALMTFGWPFGLALYDKQQEHVADAEPEPTPKSAPKPGLVLKIAGQPDRMFDFPAEWFAALEKAVGNNPSNWSPNRPTVLALGKESPEWVAKAKKIGAMVAPLAG